MKRFSLVAITVVTLMVVITGLIGCGGSSDGDAPLNQIDRPEYTLSPILLTEPLTKSDSSINAARMLNQASFGISHLGLVDITSHPNLESWIDAQMALPQTVQLPLVREYGNSSLRPPRHYVWWRTAVNAEDQLRQRVAFAMSEIFVVSDIDYTLSNAQYGIVDFYDMLGSHAFGNYRELLTDITLHPVMGIYLSMVRNEKADSERNIRPDENFARELMQLFSIGLYELDAGGDPIPAGNPSPAYTQKDVEEYARVFTGWNFADSPEWQSSNLTPYDKITPMVPQEEFHDSGSKQLLGGVSAPAGLSPREDLDLALDSIFNHPNVGPFISKALIQKLVMSNPSKAYVTRVASVFNDNGNGQRGDLGATIKAILLDVEARSKALPSGGKFKEPVLRGTHVLKAFNAVPGERSNGEYHMYQRTSDGVSALFGQAVLSSPSVFNFYSPSFGTAQNLPDNPQKTLLAPELQILNESLVSAANNNFHAMIYNAHSRAENPHRSSTLNIEPPIAMLRMGRDVYLEHMNMLLLGGLMSAGMENLLADYINETVEANRLELPDSTPNDTDNTDSEEAGPLTDAQIDEQLDALDDSVIESIVLDTLFMIIASPEHLVQQ